LKIEKNTEIMRLKNIKKNLDYAKIFAKSFRNKKKDKKKTLPLHEPTFDNLEKKYLINCIKSTFVSTRGKMVTQFEKKIKNITSSKYAIATINGTCAIHLGLKLLGAKYGDEVMLPSLTFAGTTNAILNAGCIPHFLESEYETLGIDPIKLENYLKNNTKIIKGGCYNKKTKKKISSIIVVHVFGHSSKILQLSRISKKYKIQLLEDAAECIGSFYRKKHLGTYGKVGVISFNGNKTITTGGGGILLTGDKKISRLAKHLTLNSKTSHKWEYIHDQEGFNYGMPAINAALGLAQLEKLTKFITLKRKLYKKYEAKFKNLHFLKLLKEPKNSKSNYWLQTVILEKKFKHLKNLFLKETNLSGIITRPIWKPMHKLKHLKKYPKMRLEVVEDIYSRAINIPSSPNLTKIL